MAVVTRKSTAISNRDASPTVQTMATIGGGMLKEATGFVSATNGDSINSVYPMVSVPSNARIAAIVLQCEALGAGATLDVGAYAPTQAIQSLAALGYAAGAAISNAFFASAIDVHAALASTEVVNQSGSNTLDKQEKELWDALGLASDPGCAIDISLHVSAAIAATGKVGIKVRYV